MSTGQAHLHREATTAPTAAANTAAYGRTPAVPITSSATLVYQGITHKVPELPTVTVPSVTG